MSTFLVTYDIHPLTAERCDRVTETIRSLGEWWHHLETTWLVKCDRTPEQVRDLLKEHIGIEDQLLVIDVSQAAAAWFGVNEAGSRWLETSLANALASAESSITVS